MPNPLKLRIVRFSTKLVYAAAVYVVGFAVTLALGAVKAPDPWDIWLVAAIDIVGVLYAARIFRGATEDPVPARPWWQMTATRPFSLGIAILAGLVLVLSVVQLILALAHPAAVKTVGAVDPYLVQRDVALVVEWVVFVFLYANSAARLPNRVTDLGDEKTRANRIYELFNLRQDAGAVRFLHPQVEWPTGSDGGYVRGRNAVRDLWRRQWKSIDPEITPMAVVVGGDQVFVRVREVIRDLEGKLISDSLLEHVYHLRDGLFDRMEIREIPGARRSGKR